MAALKEVGVFYRSSRPGQQNERVKFEPSCDSADLMIRRAGLKVHEMNGRLGKALRVPLQPNIWPTKMSGHAFLIL